MLEHVQCDLCANTCTLRICLRVQVVEQSQILRVQLRLPAWKWEDGLVNARDSFRMYYTCTCLVLVLQSHVSTLHVVDLHSFCTPRNCFQDYNCPRKEQQQFYKPLWKMVLVIANWIHWSIWCFIGLLIHCYTQHSLIHIVTTAGYNQNANHLYSYMYICTDASLPQGQGGND